MARIAESELILNKDGSIFHLHLLPDQLADKVILVGDPDRVEVVASNFSSQEFKVQNREFVSITGICNGKRISVISTGIGTDNIDIVLNELDALKNIDFKTRQIKEKLTALEIVRIGTSGALQADLGVDCWLMSEKVIGFDGLLNFYNNRDAIADLDFESDFLKYMNWNAKLTTPYIVDADVDLLSKFENSELKSGVTVSAPGFYGPQGRIIRLTIQDSDINEKLTNYRYQNFRITNYEMECSAIYGLSKLLGHKAVTVCAIIANRLAGTYSKDYKPIVHSLIKHILDHI